MASELHVDNRALRTEFNGRPTAVRHWQPATGAMRIDIVLLRRGTLDAQHGIVMGDELLAQALRSALCRLPEVERASIIDQHQPPDPSTNCLWFMHDLPASGAWRELGERPAILWYQNPGSVPDIRLLRYLDAEMYQVILHSGYNSAARLGLPWMPFGLDDAQLFKPMPKAREPYAVFVANAAMHRNAVGLVRELGALGSRFVLRGLDWHQLGLPSGGPVPVEECARLMAEAAVVIDSVSEGHLEDGMTSTRVYQALACGTPVVTLQPPAVFPGALHRHMVFVGSPREAVTETRRLLADPAARSKLGDGAQRTARQHDMQRRLHETWPIILQHVNGRP